MHCKHRSHVFQVKLNEVFFFHLLFLIMLFFCLGHSYIRILIIIKFQIDLTLSVRMSITFIAVGRPTGETIVAYNHPYRKLGIIISRTIYRHYTLQSQVLLDNFTTYVRYWIETWYMHFLPSRKKHIFKNHKVLTWFCFTNPFVHLLWIRNQKLKFV